MKHYIMFNLNFLQVLEKDCESVITSDTNYLSKSDSNRKIL